MTITVTPAAPDSVESFLSSYALLLGIAEGLAMDAGRYEEFRATFQAATAALAMAPRLRLEEREPSPKECP